MAASPDCRYRRRSASHEGVEHRPALGADAEQVLDQRDGLLGRVDAFFCWLGCLLEVPAYARPVAPHAALGGPDAILGVRREPALLGSRCRLDPRDESAVHEPAHLHRVDGCGDLTPVGEHHGDGSFLEYSVALGKPQRAPFREAALVAVVSEEVGLQVGDAGALVLDRRLRVAVGAVHAA